MCSNDTVPFIYMSVLEIAVHIILNPHSKSCRRRPVFPFKSPYLETTVRTTFDTPPHFETSENVKADLGKLGREKEE